MTNLRFCSASVAAIAAAALSIASARAADMETLTLVERATTDAVIGDRRRQATASGDHPDVRQRDLSTRATPTKVGTDNRLVRSHGGRRAQVLGMLLDG